MNEEERNGLMKQRRLAREKCNKLQSNWNSLREWVQKHYDEYKDMEQDAMFEFGLMLDKMNELEGKFNDN